MNNDFDKSPKSFVMSNRSRKVSCNDNESDQGEGLNNHFEMINLPERVWSMNRNRLKAKTLMKNR